MQQNLEQAREFLTLLTGEVDPEVTWQIFYDEKGGEKKPELATYFNRTLEGALPLINWSQDRFCGIYVTLNVTDGEGRNNENIVRYRAVFADFDGMEEPDWLLKPHFVTKRDELHGHAFWLVDDILCQEQFNRLQHRIHMVYGTDHQVSDAARIVRVAGFNHYKDIENPAQYVIVDDNTDGDHKYNSREIETLLAPLNAVQDVELDAWYASKQGNLSGTGYENNETYNKQFTKWITNTAPIAYQGDLHGGLGGTYTVIKVALWAHDHGINCETATALMWDNYNPRCVPPWDITEKSHFETTVRNGYNSASSAAGCKTATACFNQRPVAEPVGGWEKNNALNAKVPRTTTIEEATEHQERIAAIDVTDDIAPKNGRITNPMAAINICNYNSKSSHYELALCFDGAEYHGKHILRCKGIFYIFTDKIWEEMSDDVVKAAILRFYAHYHPNDSLIRGIFNVFCDLVNMSHVQDGTWLTPCGIDTKGLIVFNNGIYDINNPKSELMSHTSNLFRFTALNLDFDRAAVCPEWLKFLHQVSQGDEKWVMQLQEWIGYCMSPDTTHQKFALFIGKSRAGKGVITTIISELVGMQNTVAPPLNNFVKDSALNAMSKASLILVPDAHNVSYAQRDGVLTNIKAITGGDPVDFHVLYKGTHTQVFGAKIIISTNGMPEFVDASGALANRMLVFPFLESFKGREDTTLKPRLMLELGGIAQWGLEGLARIRLNGKFTEAESGIEEKEEIREDMFPLAAFTRSHCDVLEGASCTLAELYAAYRLYCTFSGISKPMTDTQLNKCLRNSELNITPTRTMNAEGHKIRGFKGIRTAAELEGKFDGNKVVPIKGFKPVAPSVKPDVKS